MAADGGTAPRQRALALLNRVPRKGPEGAPDILHRLCRAVTLDLDLAGATVTLVPDPDSHTVAAASGPAARRTEELQFDAGEGPTRDAYHDRHPVLVPDLDSVVARWPGFAPTALAAGMSATFSLPLHVGAARLGALTLYWHRPKRPADTDLRDALVFADLATELLIDSWFADENAGLEPGLDSALDTQGHVYQAQGMVMVDLGVSLPEALARMRARAYATDQSLAALATGILDGSTVMDRDERWP